MPCGCGAVLTVFCLPEVNWEMPVERELPAKIGRCYEKLLGHNFDRIYKNFLSGGFCSKVKIVTSQVLEHRLRYFFSLEIRVNFERP